jgi:hypothetical protein
LDDIEKIKAEFLNHAFDETSFEIDGQKAAEFALTCGETNPRFTDPAHPDFQTIPTYSSSLMAGRNLPEGFPLFGGIALDGGKTVVPHKPIRPGVPLTGRSYVHDIYTKTGRSGRMIFVISRMEFTDPHGEQVATADTRLVIREKISE